MTADIGDDARSDCGDVPGDEQLLPSGTPAGETSWDGDAYQARVDEWAASGSYLHAEADLVCSLDPATVLDAGCGTGRVAAELSARGVDVIGVDRDVSMIDTARQRVPDVSFLVADLADLDLGRTFDVVLLAGNVPLFTPAGTQEALLAGCGRHVSPGGYVVAGFQLGHGYELSEWDASCQTVGLVLVDRWATWESEVFVDTSDYVVSVHRRMS